MEVSKEDIKAECEEYGVDIDDDDVLEKMASLCQMYKIDAMKVAAEWLAYQASKNIPGDVSIHHLEAMERDRLCKRADSKGSKTPRTPANKSYSKEGIGNFSTPTSKGGMKRQHTPENGINKRAMSLGKSPMPCSPSIMSPTSTITPSKKYGGRTNKGEVVADFGAVPEAWKSARTADVTVSLYDSDVALKQGMKFMFQKLVDKACILSDQIEEMSAVIGQLHDIEEIYPVEEPITVVGRVGCDCNGKLNSKSVILQGVSRTLTRDMCCAADLTDVPSYNMVPGSIVAMQGYNTSGNRFVAKRVLQGVQPDLPTSAPTLQSDSLSVVLAAGPYTTSDSLSYEPLGDLMTYLEKEAPDVCIMIGPFVDSKNTLLENTLEPYDDIFKRIIDQITTVACRLRTRVVVVSSARDLHHDFVFPTPPFDLSDNKAGEVLTFVSDPCLLNIEGVIVGVTATDVLFHLGAEEIAYQPSNSDRMSRLVQYILTQRSFYPLYPCSEDVSMDYEHADEHCRLRVTPHLLVLPSDLRCFVKDVSGCCCVNPGRLAKGQIGGTFARVILRMTSEDNTSNPSLAGSMSAQVLRI